MDRSLNFKFILEIIYLVIFSIGLYFLFSVIDIEDLTNYEFIKVNKDIIFRYKIENFLFLTIIFFIFSILWLLFLEPVLPLLVLSGFVFGKWWGTLIAGSLLGACLFFVVTNFGVWSLGYYGYTLNGFLLCYTLAIPFFAYSLISTFIFSGIIEDIYKLKFEKFKSE